MVFRLEAYDLSVTFGEPQNEVKALGPVTFGIQPGEFVALLGPSGSGKSTLVRVFAGLQMPSHGSVLLDDVPLLEPSPRVGLMFQQPNLMPWRTVVDNIALPLEIAGIHKDSRHKAVENLLPVLGLQEFEEALPSQLSGGMAQRVALGRVLIQKPDVLLLDEPFGALDAMTREKIGMDLLRIWQMEKQTVLMVTHDINEAVFLADRILVMSQRPGRIIEDLAVALPRPRTLEMMYEQDFVYFARQVRMAIDRA